MITLWPWTRRHNETYVCWICLEESPKNSGDKSQWIKHSCGCNLQVHKKCYLQWIYHSIEKVYIEEVTIPANNERGDILPVTTTLDLRKICLFDLIDRYNHFSINGRSALFDYIGKYVPKPVRFMINPYLSLVNYPFRYLHMHPYQFMYLQGSISELQDLMNTLKDQCPQCKKPFVPMFTRFTKNRLSSWLTAIYYTIQGLIRDLSPFVLSALPFFNIRKLLIKLGLWQLRSVFPERLLRILLNTSTTKAFDVYGETSQGFQSISSANKLVILGMPFFLLSLVTSSHPTIFSVLNEFQWLYPLVLSLRLRQYDTSSTKPVPSIKFIRNCLLVSRILISVYSQVMNRWMRRYVFGRWLSTHTAVRQECPPEDSTGHESTRDERMQGETREQTPETTVQDKYPHPSLLSYWYYQHYYKITTSYDEIFRATWLWPACAMQVSKYITLPVSRYIPERLTYDMAPDDVAMCCNFLSYGAIGLIYRVFSLLMLRLRVQEIKELDELIDEVSKDD